MRQMSSDTKMERKKNTQQNQALPITGIFCLEKGRAGCISTAGTWLPLLLRGHSERSPHSQAQQQKTPGNRFLLITEILRWTQAGYFVARPKGPERVSPFLIFSFQLPISILNSLSAHYLGRMNHKNKQTNKKTNPTKKRKPTKK